MLLPNRVNRLVVALAFFTTLCSAESIKLIDEDLSNFEIFMGVPHESVIGLPEGTYQSSNVHKGEPMGLDADVKGVYSVQIIEGEPVLHITGEIYGGLTTKEEYGNYHLSTYFKWGDKKWPPRENVKRDSGILYHCYGEHGSFWSVWKTCMEYQVQETDLGDYIGLPGNTAKPKKTGRPKAEIRGENKKFNPDSESYFNANGYISAFSEHDAPHGEWNLLEIYTVGNDAVHLVNGNVVMVVENAHKPDGTPLSQGQIQIQSEAAECYYKDLVLEPINNFPDSIKKQVRFKEDP